MYVCMYVCMYVHAYVRMCICTYAYICMHIYMLNHVYIWGKCHVTFTDLIPEKNQQEISEYAKEEAPERIVDLVGEIVIKDSTPDSNLEYPNILKSTYYI